MSVGVALFAQEGEIGGIVVLWIAVGMVYVEMLGCPAVLARFMNTFDVPTKRFLVAGMQLLGLLPVWISAAAVHSTEVQKVAVVGAEHFLAAGDDVKRRVAFNTMACLPPTQRSADKCITAFLGTRAAGLSPARFGKELFFAHDTYFFGSHGPLPGPSEVSTLIVA